MSTKIEVKNGFINYISELVCLKDYNYNRKNSFTKSINKEKFFIRYEFFGSGVISATVYFGVRVVDIEKRLKNLPFSNFLGKSNAKETIFQKFNVIVRNFKNEIVPSFYNALSDMELQANILCRFIGEIEKIFANKNSLAIYALTDNSLPLGHHAFRVPFLLMDVGMHVECEKYMEKVITKDFIENYDEFRRQFYQSY